MLFKRLKNGLLGFVCLCCEQCGAVEVVSDLNEFGRLSEQSVRQLCFQLAADLDAQSSACKLIGSTLSHPQLLIVEKFRLLLPACLTGLLHVYASGGKTAA